MDVLKILLTEDEVLQGRDTDQKCEIFNFVDIYSRACRLQCVVEHESVMPLLSLSPLNVLTH